MMNIGKFGMTIILVAALFGCGEKESHNPVASFEGNLLQQSREVHETPVFKEHENRMEEPPVENTQPGKASGAPKSVPMPHSCRAYIEDVKRCVQKTDNRVLLDQLNKQLAVLFESAPAKNFNTADMICRQAQAGFQKNLARLGCAEEPPAPPPPAPASAPAQTSATPAQTTATPAQTTATPAQP